MITLYQFERTWGIPNLSNFCVKVETYLRMLDIPYDIVATLPTKAPKGKLPYIEDAGEQIADSNFIVDYLKEKYGDRLDQHLNGADRSIQLSMQRLIEDHLYWIVMYTRWQSSVENWEINRKAVFGVFPPLIRNLVAVGYRKIIRRQIRGHGIGRHKPLEIYRLGYADFDALSDFLGTKPFFMGAKPASLDATAFGALITTIGCSIESPVKDYGITKKNLVDYCERMKQCYFPEFC